jgi:hypothetical protein
MNKAEEDRCCKRNGIVLHLTKTTICGMITGLQNGSITAK